MVGDNVTITVLSVKGNQVRIGVKAPPEVAVHREEIYNRIHEADSGKESSVLNPESSKIKQTETQPSSENKSGSHTDEDGLSSSREN